MSKELIIYCDESTERGQYYSNFYGGALVRSADLLPIETALTERKKELGLSAEVKWQKISSSYRDRYTALIDTFFDFIEQDKIKARIMFTHNIHVAQFLTKYHHEHYYFLLYHEFIKYAFGLQYANTTTDPIVVRLILDELPDTKAKSRAFIDRIVSINKDPEFSRTQVSFSDNQIAEVDSKNHVILQCLDIVLGSMQFRLNDKHKTIPEGKHRRGNRTIAKEHVYRHINQRIRKVYTNFNAGISTGTQGDHANRWRHSYRHWRFVPRNWEPNKQYVAKSKAGKK